MLLLDLPTEVLIHILTYLDCPTLLRVSQLSGNFHSMVFGVAPLRYIVELRQDGLIESGNSSLPYADRLEMLRTRRMAWRTLDWQHSHLPSFTGSCTAYELVSGIFMKHDRGLLSTLPLPFRTSDASIDLSLLQQERSMPYSPRDFAIDPSQDLIIFLRIIDNHTQSIVLHMASITTGKRHPEAKEHTIFYCIPIDVATPINGAFMQISDDNVALFTFGDGHGYNRLMTWNWKTGIRFFDLDSTWEQPHDSAHSCEPLLSLPNLDFAWIKSDDFILIDRQGSGGLALCRIGPTPGDPLYVTTLLFPDLQDGVEVQEVKTHSNALMGGTSLPEEFQSAHRIFSTDPNERIHLVQITYAVRNATFKVLMAIHQQVFLWILKVHDHHGPVQAYAWDDWGPKYCRVIATGPVPPFPWLRYAHGTKVILPLYPRSLAHSDIRIFDFSRGACYPPVSHSHEHRCGGTSQPWPGEACDAMPIHTIPTIPCQSHVNNTPSRVINDSVFRFHVVTCLPYFTVRRKVDYSLHALLLDEDRIVALKDPSTVPDSRAGLHLFAI